MCEVRRERRYLKMHVIAEVNPSSEVTFPLMSSFVDVIIVVVVVISEMYAPFP